MIRRVDTEKHWACTCIKCKLGVLKACLDMAVGGVCVPLQHHGSVEQNSKLLLHCNFIRHASCHFGFDKGMNVLLSGWGSWHINCVGQNACMLGIEFVTRLSVQVVSVSHELVCNCANASAVLHCQGVVQVGCQGEKENTPAIQTTSKVESLVEMEEKLHAHLNLIDLGSSIC